MGRRAGGRTGRGGRLLVGWGKGLWRLWRKRGLGSAG